MGVYQVCTGDFLHGIFLVGLGVDSTVIADGVDLLAFPSNLGDSVTLGLLELLNELVHDIDENNLQGERLANTLCQHLGEGSSYLKARLEQLLGNEATANVSTSEVDSFESHLVQCIFFNILSFYFLFSICGALVFFFFFFF